MPPILVDGEANLPPAVGALAAWVGQEIDAADPRALAVLSAATNRVTAYVGNTWSDSAAPNEVVDVIVQVAARVWLNPAGLESVTLDDGTRRWGSSAGMGLYLTDADKEVLAGHIVGGPPDLGTLSITTGARHNPTIYVPTGPPPSGQPFPWYDANDPMVD